MGDWPRDFLPPVLTLSSMHPDSIGDRIGIAPGNVLNPVANQAFYIPFVLYQPIIARMLFVVNGSAVNGNVDVGIYDRRGTRIVSVGGGDAQAGINDAQGFNIPDTLLGPGMFYFAVVLDNPAGTARLVGPVIAGNRMKGAGLARQAAAFPLPATATMTSITAGSVPLVGLTTRAFI